MPGARPLLMLVPSGASERGTTTTLQQARTPNLDRLAARATLLQVRTTPAGLPAGTEVGLPTLLGLPVRTPPSRGYLDAAALGVEPLDGTAAWRLDLHDRRGPWVPDDAPAVATALTEAIGAPVHHVRGHRFVLVGPRAWGDAPDRVRSDRPRRVLVGRSWQRRLAGARAHLPQVRIVVWGRGAPVSWTQRPTRRTVVVGTEGGPAIGFARVAGLEAASVRAGRGHAIGELRALAERAAQELAAPDGPVVVVHSHHIDDAAHHGRRADKAALLGAFDLEVTGPLVAHARDLQAGVWWCPDFAVDPSSGTHLPDPVPSVWTSDARDGAVRHLHPVTERSMRYAPTADGRTLLASLLRMADPDVA